MADERGIKRFLPLAAGVILALAAIMFWIGADVPIRQMPDTPESADAFYCTACEHTTTMTPRQRAKWIMKTGLVVTRGDPNSEQKAGHRIPYFACPKCEKMTLMVATKCVECDNIFFGQTCNNCSSAPGRPKEGASKPKEKSTRPNRK